MKDNNRDAEVSIVIPCYNSEKTIEKTICDIQTEIDDLKYEIILIDDASNDGTYERIRELTATNNNIRGLSLSKNFGQHAALLAGFRFVTGDIVLCMDDDGQTPASEIKKMLLSLTDDVDVVYAEYTNKKHAWYRNVGSKANAKMMEWLLNKPREIYISSFFIARRYIIEEICQYKGAFPYMMGLVLRSTNRIVNVEVEHKERKEGISGYSLKKLLTLWMNGFTAFSIKPLRIADVCGGIMAIIGLASALGLILKRLIIGTSAVLGWYSLISTILFVGGLQMLVLGITGEYVGRSYLCISDAPQYIIRNRCGFTEAENDKVCEIQAD